MSKDENQKWMDILSKENSPFKTNKYIEALKHVRHNYMQFYNSDLFLSLKRETLCEILDSNELNVDSEEVVFNSVRRWLDSNSSVREASLKPLLRVVRLPLLPLKFLNDVVKPLLPSLTVEDFNKAFHLVVNNYTPFVNDSNMSDRIYQTLSLENRLKTSIEFEPEPMKMLSIGSDDFQTINDVEIYDDILDKWTTPKNLAIFRRNYSVVLVNGNVLIIGGTKSHHENTEPLNTVQSLDLSTGVLLSELPLNDARQCAATAVTGEGRLSYLFVLGGRGENADLDTIEKWNPNSRKWTRVTPSMSNKRNGLAAAALDQKIYALGGKINGHYSNTVEAFDMGEEIWETKAPMKEKRAHFCVAAFDGFLYAVAGSKSDQLQINTVEKYNPSADNWVTIANISATGHVAVSGSGYRLMCAGGKNSRSVFEYDEQKNKWNKLANMHRQRAGFLIMLPQKLKNLRFDWADQRILLMIGNQDSDTTCCLQTYDTRINQWTKFNDLDMKKINYCVAYDGHNLLTIGGNLTNDYQFNTVESIDLRTGIVSQLAPLNCRRQNSAAAVVKQGKLTFVFVFGGMKYEELLNTVERWDTFDRTWTLVSSMPVARTGHGAVLLNNEIYIVGGKTGKETYSTTVEAYDFKNDQWTPKASMNKAKARFGITTFDNCIYVAGGYADSATPVNTVECYDPKENTWTTIANISSTGTVGLFGMKNMLMCAGGKSSNFVEEYDKIGKSWRKLTPLVRQCSGFVVELQPDIEIYSGDWNIPKRPSNRLIFVGKWHAYSLQTFDIVDKKWRKLKDFSINRINLNANIFSNKLLLIGGRNKSGDALNSIDAIDLSSGTIQPFPPLKQPRNYPSSVVVTDGGKETLYVIGGLSGDENPLSSVEIWDPRTEDWIEGIPMTTARYDHCCVFLNGKIYAVGGSDGKRLKIVEAFDVKKKVWEKKASMIRGMTNFGMTTFNDKIYVAGSSGTSWVQRYDPLTDSWTDLARINSSGKVGLCGLGNRLICAGGLFNTTQEYDVDKNEWTHLPSMILSSYNLLHGFLLELPENSKLENW